MLFSPQIPLQLMPRRDCRFDDYVAGPNAAVVKALQQVVDDPGSHIFLMKRASGRGGLFTWL